MNLLFFCPRWGSEALSWPDFAQKVKEAGYDGIEYAIPATATDRELDEAWNAAVRNGLSMLPQHFDTVATDFAQHVESYEQRLENIKNYPAAKINSQTGKDFFSFEQNRLLIELGNRFGVLHETHRGKFSFAAHVTKTYLEAIPDLTLTLDLSHWCCTAESLLTDQPEALQLAVLRTGHLHARVGYPEGPQVPDPFSAPWEAALAAHLHCWDAVVGLQKDARQTPTITPECGPFPYMVHAPATGKPIADQWDVNGRMMEFLRRRYA